ncbi:unnamed protein product [Effrenium voratum]|uniref:Uncharacterized protein n=1 Tax=Effrenium voratum TaxID=2562239 RepID=A0AA36NA58_9DINO|nr:unnamed protein product [Effrenium voratum]
MSDQWKHCKSQCPEFLAGFEWKVHRDPFARRELSKVRTSPHLQADAADRVEALPGGCRLQNRCFSSPGRTQTGHKEKRRSPPAFVADVEKILSRPVTASQMRSQDSMEKLKSKAQGDMMPHSDGSPPAEDGKLERTFTTIMEEMESELVALSDEEAVKKEPAVPSGGLLCFLNSGCWSTGTTPNQRVPVIGKA